MKKILLTLLASCALPAMAQVDAPAAKAADATQFIRVDRDAQHVRLQTGVTRYVKAGVTVDLIGAVHIADAKYYQQLNKEFTQYEALLYEMIGGENIAKGPEAKAENAEPQEKVKDPMMAMLGNVYTLVSKFLQLQGQKEGIDYSPKNFVHADLSLAEFQKLQTEKGESLLGFAMQNAQNEKAAANQPDPAKLLTAILSGNANLMKLELVDTLGGANDQMGGMLGESVIIGDRNKACLKVLQQQVQAGKKKLAIFYGAAHFPDMEKRMLKAGYRKIEHRWLTAWDIPKAAAAPQKKAPQKAPEAMPDAA
ncbi:hypothetical protein JO972_11175 [Verrucomicrobiaceae bacterium 5K15]|uniref:TraB/GumN family protein n=1 Tax=Oceaniferula flava TaxID=2800421 RepID=A0AAE2V8G3_9BACT|nr:hypothetical protein [Oceaniferula flavus]MBK1855522.1 hypothetical protein [Oceaniferula flavus]MBM1136828.1 hypothetical protein [Oceaniferula flavus]